MIRRAVLTLSCFALAGPAAAGWWEAFVDALRGEPGPKELARTERFSGGGVSFDVPAVLRRQVQGEERSREWSFSRGSFELELHDVEGRFEVADLLGTLVDAMGGGPRIKAEGPEPGRKVTLCGREVESVRARLQALGDWTVYEGFDLPAPEGRTRWLMFEDEPVKGQPSATARATYAAVLGSLRCEPVESGVATPR